MRYFVIAAFLLSMSILAPAQTVPSLSPPDSAQFQNAPVAVPEPTQKALEYRAGGDILWMVDVVWGFLVPAVFLFTGFSSKIRTWAEKLGRRWFFTVGIYFIIFSAVFFVINLPLSYYEDFVRLHAYDLSNQTFGKWFGDALKGLMVGIVVGFFFLWIPYRLLEKSPKRWWLYVGILMIPFTIVALIVSPIWIQPLFNDFGPMKNKVLEAKILALADRAGIEGSRVFEVNKSVDTKQVNAYVTGFMGSKRIVLWDNTINKLNEKEILFVMAHEMGHYVLGHVWKLIAFISLISLLTLYLAYLTAGAFVNRFKQRFGFDRLSDVASLPLILLLINFFGFLITPFANWYSRSIEHEADRFGLEITRSNHDAATAFVKLQMENLSVPRPGMMYRIWQADHPVLGDRIDFANEYKPWEKGEPLMYGEYFKQ